MKRKNTNNKQSGSSKKQEKSDVLFSEKIIEKIFSFMDYLSILSSLSVCKNWKDIGRKTLNKRNWFSIWNLKNGFSLTSKQLENILISFKKNCPHLETITLDNSKITDDQIKLVKKKNFFYIFFFHSKNTSKKK